MMRVNTLFKKFVGAASVVGVLGVGTVSALDLSGGFQAAFRNNFGGGIEGTACQRWSGMGCMSEEVRLNQIGGGFNLFLDATYVMVSLGMTFTTGQVFEESYSYQDSWATEREDVEVTLSQRSIDLGIFGKYPVDLGSMIFFPTIGIEYQRAVGLTIDALTSYSYQSMYGDNYRYSYDEQVEFGNNTVTKMFSRYWLKFGAGMDIPLSGAMFLRASALYGIGLASEIEQNVIDAGRIGAIPIEMEEGIQLTVDPVLSHGLDVRVGLGFRF